MSRTDKDRPWWVVQHQENVLISHDHRRGVCIEETLDYARGSAGRSWGRSTRHWRHCSKRVVRTFYCTKQEPYTYSHYAYYWGTNFSRYRTPQECWTWRCRCDVPRGRRHRYSVDCPTWGRVQCDGHTEVTTDTSIPCTCDNYPEAPTCTPEYPYDYGYLRGGAPSWYNNQNWTRPERRRERDSLRDLAREYNANGDLDDDDFENRQHRHEGIWNWW